MIICDKEIPTDTDLTPENQNGCANASIIACVTGASGMVGSKIVRKLKSRGYAVRTLSRTKQFDDKEVESFCGGIDDKELLGSFLHKAHLLFHCAAELNDESKMWDINVSGTERILNLVAGSTVTYFCYFSSAGVIGLTKELLVNEKTQCNPQNRYEESKWAAEKLVSKGIKNCSTIILRPTDVIDDHRPGALLRPLRRNLIDRLVVFLKGNECAHIIHAEDVADAAIYFVNRGFEKPATFFVSCDHEPVNTFGGLWELYKSIQQGLPEKEIKSKIYLPIFIPYILRRLWRGACNLGNVRYSSEKLLSNGFSYRLGVKGAVHSIVVAHQS